MPVDLIESHDGLCRLQDDWQRLYQVDSEASVFLSWRWMFSLLMRRQDRPCILAWHGGSSHTDVAGNGPRYSAFLPLRRQVRLSTSRGEFYNALSFAGNYWADYTGVLCDPAVQAQALPELGTALTDLGWRRLFLESVRQSDDRQEALLAPLRVDENLRIEDRHLSDNDGATDLGKAPVVVLPGTFEAWMQDSLSANTRQKLRRFRRRLVQADTLSVRFSIPETRDRDIAALQHWWRSRWAQAKGQHVDTLAEKYGTLVREGLEAGDMLLFVLLQGESPAALHACYVDPVRRVLYFFVGARDLSMSTLAPGLVLHAQAIEWAIEHRLVQYDLLRGDEHYKYSLGAVDQEVTSFQITRKHLEVEHRFLDIECRTAALATLCGYQVRGRGNRVHELYSQLLESWPGDVMVLNQYGSWLRDIGDQQAANAIFRALGEDPGDGSVQAGTLPATERVSAGT